MRHATPSMRLVVSRDIRPGGEFPGRRPVPERGRRDGDDLATSALCNFVVAICGIIVAGTAYMLFGLAEALAHWGWMLIERLAP